MRAGPIYSPQKTRFLCNFSSNHNSSFLSLTALLQSVVVITLFNSERERENTQKKSHNFNFLIIEQLKNLPLLKRNVLAPCAKQVLASQTVGFGKNIMCPPGPSTASLEIGVCWTDEDVIVSLDKLQHGSPLPSNVIADVNPFEYSPSDLPRDVWFFVCTESQKETTVGFWKTKGDECQIYSDSKLTGWRLTFEFCEGQSDQERKTDWVMQEYWITLKGSNNLKASGSLCIVFPCDGGCRKQKRQRHGSPLAEELNSRDQNDSTENSKVIVQHDEKESSDCAVNQDDIDCFSRGDYLELLDLENPRSSSSSSDNSSCLSMASDDVFDYLALLNDLEPESCKEVQSQSTNSNLNVMTSSIPDDFIVCPATTGTVITGEGSEKSPGKESQENSLQGSPLEAKVDDNKDDTKYVASTSDEASTSERSVPDTGKKTLGKMKKYLCFISF